MFRKSEKQVLQDILTEYKSRQTANHATISNQDIQFLLKNTDFDEYDIREWFREFLKVIIRSLNC